MSHGEKKNITRFQEEHEKEETLQEIANMCKTNTEKIAILEVSMKVLIERCGQDLRSIRAR